MATRSGGDGGTFGGPSRGAHGGGTIAEASAIKDGVKKGATEGSRVPGSQGNKSGSAVGSYPKASRAARENITAPPGHGREEPGEPREAHE